MAAQASTSSNDLPMTGSLTTLPLRNGWTLVHEERSSAPEVPKAQEDGNWELLGEEPPAADDGPALMTGPFPPPTNLGPDEVDLGPVTSSGPEPYVAFASGAASEFDSCTFGPGTTNSPWTTNAPSLGPEPPQFGSGSAIYSFCPQISPDEPTAFFSPGPIFSSFEPELVDSRPLAFSGATHTPTISDPNPPQSSRPASSSPETVVSPSLDISSNQVHPGPSYTLGHEPYSVGPENYNYGPTHSFGPGSSSAMDLTFGPRSTAFSPGPSANDRMMGALPMASASGSNTGPGLCSFAPTSISNDHGPKDNDTNIGPGQAPLGPRPNGSNDLRSSNSSNNSNELPILSSISNNSNELSIHSRTSNNSNELPSRTSNIGPGPISFGPGPHVYDKTSGPNSASYGPIIGPASTSFGPGPHVYDTTSVPHSASYDTIIGPGPISFGPGPTIYKPTALPITVEHTSIKSESSKRFLCAPCNRGFDRIEHLERHKASNSHADSLKAEGMPLNTLPFKTFTCSLCDHTFNRQDNLRAHLLRHMDKGARSRTRQVSVDESVRMGLAHIDPRCAN